MEAVDLFSECVPEAETTDLERRPLRPGGTKAARGPGGVDIIGKKPKKEKSLEAGERAAFGGLGARGWSWWLQSQGSLDIMPLPEISLKARARVETE